MKDIAVYDDTVTLPDILTKKHPYRNKKTGKIVYLSWWELYVDRQRELMARAFIYGTGALEQKLHIDDWELLKETAALKVLYGQKEE